MLLLRQSQAMAIPGAHLVCCTRQGDSHTGSVRNPRQDFEPWRDHRQIRGRPISEIHDVPLGHLSLQVTVPSPGLLKLLPQSLHSLRHFLTLRVVVNHDPICLCLSQERRRDAAGLREVEQRTEWCTIVRIKCYHRLVLLTRAARGAPGGPCMCD